jgi:hypothetical protein
MSADSALVGYVIGGLPLLIGGLHVLHGVDGVGLPPLVAGGGVVLAALGVAETLGALGTRVGRAGKTYANATNDPMKKQRRDQSMHEALKLLFFLSGPIYLYALELQYVPYGQWVLHLVTMGPSLVGIYLLGGPIVTMLFVGGRLILVDSLSARLAPERI